MRRNLQINNFDQLEKELDYLEKATEFETTGVWSFFQILIHLSDQIHFSMKGYPHYLPFFLRKTIGRIAIRKILKDSIMKPGYYNPNAPRKREDGDFRAALQRYKESINDFRNFNEQFALHPVFDKLEKSEWESLHCIHAALHLSFVHPVIKDTILLEEDSSSKQLQDAKPTDIPTAEKESKPKIEIIPAAKKSSKKKSPIQKKKTIAKKKKTIPPKKK